MSKSKKMLVAKSPKEQPPVVPTDEERKRLMKAPQLTEEGRKELKMTRRIEALSYAHMHDTVYRE